MRHAVAEDIGTALLVSAHLLACKVRTEVPDRDLPISTYLKHYKISAYLPLMYTTEFHVPYPGKSQTSHFT